MTISTYNPAVQRGSFNDSVLSIIENSKASKNRQFTEIKIEKSVRCNSAIPRKILAVSGVVSSIVHLSFNGSSTLGIANLVGHTVTGAVLLKPNPGASVGSIVKGITSIVQMKTNQTSESVDSFEDSDGVKSLISLKKKIITNPSHKEIEIKEIDSEDNPKRLKSILINAEQNIKTAKTVVHQIVEKKDGIDSAKTLSSKPTEFIYQNAGILLGIGTSLLNTICASILLNELVNVDDHSNSTRSNNIDPSNKLSVPVAAAIYGKTPSQAISLTVALLSLGYLVKRLFKRYFVVQNNSTETKIVNQKSNEEYDDFEIEMEKLYTPSSTRDDSVLLDKQPKQVMRRSVSLSNLDEFFPDSVFLGKNTFNNSQETINDYHSCNGSVPTLDKCLEVEDLREVI